jgi:hypothetical protein
MFRMKKNNYPSSSTVPASFVSVWRRDYLFSTEEGEDTSTRVYWIQSGLLFADLRVPANRPDFSGVNSLADCSDEQVRWLASQKGFAGWLDVSGDRDLFHWHRVLDYQPDSSVEDIGRMSVQDGYVLEEGLDSDFREHWVRISPDHPEHRAYVLGQVTGPDGSTVSWCGYLICVGEYFMLAIDRREALPRSESLLSLYQGDYPRLRREGLDMEISFGLIEGERGDYQVTLSTHPFREGCLLFDDKAVVDEAGRLLQSDRGYQLTWVPFRVSGEDS